MTSFIKTQLATLGLIKKSDRYLLTKIQVLADPEAHGKWGCIAGIVNFGETFEQALHREAMEEVGIEIVIDRQIPLIVQNSEADQRGVVISYLCHMKDESQPIIINSEASEYGWFTVEEILQKDLYLSTADIVRAAL